MVKPSPIVGSGPGGVFSRLHADLPLSCQASDIGDPYRYSAARLRHRPYLNQKLARRDVTLSQIDVEPVECPADSAARCSTFACV